MALKMQRLCDHGGGDMVPMLTRPVGRERTVFAKALILDLELFKYMER